MPYVENYEFGNFIFSQKGFIPKTNPVQIKGEVSLKSLNPEFIRKHKIKITDITEIAPESPYRACPALAVG